MSDAPVLPTGRCPICDADDTYIAQRADRDEYFVECLNCGIYSATRKAYRHFEYLRWRGEPAGLERLTQMASVLKDRAPGTLTRLDYDTWQSLLPSPPVELAEETPQEPDKAKAIGSTEDQPIERVVAAPHKPDASE
jgi:hypothetical protein